jgi:D-glycerate 3-kinase
MGPLLARKAARADALLVGLCGPQGSGKSTLVEALQRDLAERGLRAAVLSIDDVYLPRAERRRLARDVHPLLATRGPPGTHDIDLAVRVIDDLLAGRTLALPRFDKAADDRLPATAWPVFEGPADVVLFEGWCVGAAPEDAQALIAPVNDLERDEDRDGRWRAYVNTALRAYQTLFARMDLLIQLRPPGFETVLAWRRQQEAQLRAERAGQGVMSDAEVARFVQHYERITRHILSETPSRADIVIDLGPAREVLRIETPEA